MGHEPVNNRQEEEDKEIVGMVRATEEWLVILEAKALAIVIKGLVTQSATLFQRAPGK